MPKLLKLVAFLVLYVLAAAPVLTQKQPTGHGSEITFKISVSLEFKGRIVSGSLRKSEIPELLDLPVRNGNSDLKEGYGVEMIRLACLLASTHTAALRQDPAARP